MMNRIKAVLKEQGMTQRELAKQMKVSPSYINELCTNQNNPTIAKIVEIAAALHVPAYTLISDYDPEALRAKLWEEIKDKVETND